MGEYYYPTLEPVPAAAITPGVRWQRSEPFLDDLPVEECYQQLLETGEIDQDAIIHGSSLISDYVIEDHFSRLRIRRMYGLGRVRDPVIWEELNNAIARRAAEDGYEAVVQTCMGVKLAGPLDGEWLDPQAQARADAAKTYAMICSSGETFVGSGAPHHPLMPEGWWAVFDAEMKRLAEADGYVITWQAEDDIGCFYRRHRRSAPPSIQAESE